MELDTEWRPCLRSHAIVSSAFQRWKSAWYLWASTKWAHPGVVADAVAKRYRPWPKGLRTDSLPWFGSPLVQGASRLRYTDKAQVAATGPYWPKGARNKKKKGHTLGWYPFHHIERTLEVYMSLCRGTQRFQECLCPVWQERLCCSGIADGLQA